MRYAPIPTAVEMSAALKAVLMIESASVLRRFAGGQSGMAMRTRRSRTCGGQCNAVRSAGSSSARGRRGDGGGERLTVVVRLRLLGRGGEVPCGRVDVAARERGLADRLARGAGRGRPDALLGVGGRGCGAGCGRGCGCGCGGGGGEGRAARRRRGEPPLGKRLRGRGRGHGRREGVRGAPGGGPDAECELEHEWCVRPGSPGVVRESVGGGWGASAGGTPSYY